MRSAFCLLFICLMGLSACGQDEVKTDLALKYLVQQPAAKGQGKPPLLLLLHGYGSDEKDLFELRKFLPQRFIIVAARAPYPLPNGGNQWFDRDRQFMKYEVVQAQVNTSRDLVLQLIDQLCKRYHADPGNVYVMGFSQGAIMSYATGLTHPQKVKGIGILSGILPASLKPQITNSDALKRLRIFVAHGTDDKVLLYEDGSEGVTWLRSLGLQPEFHSYPGMPHAISPDVVNDINKWLTK